MKKLGIWFLLSNKRLYKKITFIIIMLLIPLCVLALSVVAKDQSGLIKVALASESDSDELCNQIIEELVNDSKLIGFMRYETPEKAVEAVKMGRADSAWIFPRDIEARMSKFAEETTESNYIVRVVEREENVALQISHEKLSGILYKHVSDDFYLDFVRTKVPEASSITDGELLECFSGFEMDGRLFSFAYPDGKAAGISTKEIGYFAAPIRGLLAVIIVLAGLAAAMFCIQDEKRGTYAWICESKRVFVNLGFIGIAVANVAVVMIAALMLTGNGMGFLREIASLVTFVLCTVMFCTLIRYILPKVQFLGVVIPTITVVMIAVCPIFFDLKKLAIIQYLFPPTYYINGAYSNKYLVYAVIYSAVCAALLFVVNKIKMSRRKID